MTPVIVGARRPPPERCQRSSGSSCWAAAVTSSTALAAHPPRTPPAGRSGRPPSPAPGARPRRTDSGRRPRASNEVAPGDVPLRRACGSSARPGPSTRTPAARIRPTRRRLIGGGLPPEGGWGHSGVTLLRMVPIGRNLTTEPTEVPRLPRLPLGSLQDAGEQLAGLERRRLGVHAPTPGATRRPASCTWTTTGSSPKPLERATLDRSRTRGPVWQEAKQSRQ
jgi:hypothetical protein